MGMRRPSPGLILSPQVPLGRHNLPIERVHNVMRDMNRDMQYKLLCNNCQTWLQEFFDRLGIPVPKEAFTDTWIGRTINKVFDSDDVDTEQAYRRHNRRNHSTESSARNEKLETVNNPFSWTGIAVAVAVGAAAAQLAFAVMNEKQRRHRDK